MIIPLALIEMDMLAELGSWERCWLKGFPSRWVRTKKAWFLAKAYALTCGMVPVAAERDYSDLIAEGWRTRGTKGHWALCIMRKIAGR